MSRPDSTARPVLLLGSQRSGTTALAHALAAAYAEAGGIFTVNGRLPYLLQRWITSADLQHRHLRADELLHALARRPAQGPAAARWHQDTERALRAAARTVAERESTEPPPAPAALIGQIVRTSYQRWPCWGDKYNEYLLTLPWLLQVIPDARVLMLVRHPADVAASMMAWTGDRPYNPGSRSAALAKWQSWNEGWLSVAEQLPAADRLVVEYPALCEGRYRETLREFLPVPLRDHLARLRPTPPGDRHDLPPEIERTWQSLRAQLAPVG